MKLTMTQERKSMRSIIKTTLSLVVGSFFLLSSSAFVLAGQVSGGPDSKAPRLKYQTQKPVQQPKAKSTSRSNTQSSNSKSQTNKNYGQKVEQKPVPQKK